jgi:hypothetical protein
MPSRWFQAPRDASCEPSPQVGSERHRGAAKGGRAAGPTSIVITGARPPQLVALTPWWGYPPFWEARRARPPP